MKRFKRPSPTKTNYYLVSDSGVIFIGKLGAKAVTLRGYPHIHSWSDWENLIRRSLSILNGLGEVQDPDDFIGMVRSSSKHIREVMFNTYFNQRPQWVLDGEVTLDPDGYTINYRDFI